MNAFKKTVIAGLAAITLAGSLSTPAAAGFKGWGIGAGIVAGLAVSGAIAASNYGYGYGYRCWYQTREFVDYYGYVTYRRVRVCG